MTGGSFFTSRMLAFLYHLKFDAALVTYVNVPFLHIITTIHGMLLIDLVL